MIQKKIALFIILSAMTTYTDAKTLNFLMTAEYMETPPDTEKPFEVKRNRLCITMRKKISKARWLLNFFKNHINYGMPTAPKYETLDSILYNFLSNKIESFGSQNTKNQTLLMELLPYIMADAIEIRKKKKEKDWSYIVRKELTYNTKDKTIKWKYNSASEVHLNSTDHFRLSAHKDPKNFQLEENNSNNRETSILNFMKKRLLQRVTFEDLNSE